MKDQYDALKSRAREFRDAIFHYSGPERGEWLSRCSDVLDYLDEVEAEVNKFQ